MLCANIAVNGEGRLTFAGQDTALLAQQFGTPLYLMDEDRIRENCRTYTAAFARLFPAGSRVLYASKACSFRRMYEIAAEEGMGVDVVSDGEIHTAALAGFDLKNAYFHGNNKTDGEIRFAMERGVGTFVVDGEDELRAVAAEAERRGVRQRILLRVTPGIDPHTYEAVATGKVDSKFGVAIETGQAAALTAQALSLPQVELAGFHCHVGSQVFGEDVFERAAVVMLEFMAQIRDTLGFTASVLDLGGGFGVRYDESDPIPDVAGKLAAVAAALRGACERLNYPMPAILMEPGRGIVADAGMTLYTVGAVKRIPGYKNYVSVDGGMTDNPRYALYGALHTVLPAGRMNEARTLRCDVVGKCCESGDVIRPDADLPQSTARGDLLAVCTTGAYNYSMASNYNRVSRPAVVMLRGGDAGLAVRRETPEDLAGLDQ